MSACHRCALSRSVTCGWRDRRWTCLFLDCGGPGPRVTYQKVIIPVACHVEGGGSTAWDAVFLGSVGRLLEDEVSERRGGRKGRQALGSLAVGQGGMMMDPGLGQSSSSSGQARWDGWTWFWLGVPFALSGSLAAETASARGARDGCSKEKEREKEYVLCGTRFTARRCCAGEKVWKEPQGGTREGGR